MEERYIKAIDPDKWIRPAGWPALPNITTADNRVAGVYAVYENKTNRLQIQHTVAGSNNTIDWGDGTSVTWNGTAGQTKLYDYSTIVAPVLVDSAGFNYKPVLIQFQLNSGTANVLNLSNTIGTVGAYVQANWLDVLVSWPVTFQFPQRPRLLERLNVLKGPGNVSISAVYQAMSGLRVLEGTLFGPGNTNNYTSVQTSFAGMGPANLGDIEINRIGTPINASTMFQSSFIKSVGNITLNNVSNTDTFFNACRELKSVGNITMTTVIATTSFFNSCTMLETVGTINVGSTGTLNAGAMFNGCTYLREVVFTNAIKITSTASMFTGCIRLRKLRLPNMSVSFSVLDCDLERNELIDLFNDLAVVVGQTIIITNNPGVATLTAGDLAIATGKGWTVTTV